MTALLGELERFQPSDETEARSLQRILRHVQQGGALFDRARWDGHLTASAFIVDASGRALLLILHRKLGRWLQPGGHGEPGDVDPLVVARREAHEETGLDDLELHPAAPAPFDVDVHLIPARPNEPAHEHLDIRYLFRAAPGAQVRIQTSEVRDHRWTSLDEIDADSSDASVARAARKIAALRRSRGAQG